ncbi:glycosyltransferase family 4 protein [Nakamurella leprariae]|uniref:Glycosyltransferase family 4 protein n=1 Tax=Nakamurella leprariae TaxID=2803911 RepID=A0A938Y635_9ACTN|nr:glycosyltransferase family 4 protein [Nakamurella leprariae]MBM9466726.1 glycosyltransferase family 4 protein [Nakamurella leprariae]
MTHGEASGSSLRILTDSQRLFPIGGIEVGTLHDVLALRQRGHDVAVAYEQDGDDRAVYREAGVDLLGPYSFAFEPRRALTGVASFLPAARAVQRYRPDVLWLNRFEHIVWAQAVSRWARLRSRPIVCHLHHVPNYDRVRLLGTGVETFVAVSEHMRDVWVDRGLPSEKVVVVHNAVVPERYPMGGDAERTAARAALGLPQDRPIVLYYGLLSTHKGADVLARAFRRLPPEALLVMVGADVQPEDTGVVRAALAELPPGSVRTFGNQRDVVPFLHAADVVAFPTQLPEAFGRVAVEAMATGRPVVASRIGAVPEVLGAEMSDLLVDAADEAAWAQILGSRLHWRTEDPDLGARCAALVDRRFRFSGHIDALERVLIDAARSRPRVVA